MGGPPKLTLNPRKPESKIEEEIIDFLKERQWFVKKFHGNMYQSGIPDLGAWHVKHGFRLIEIKCPDQYCFTSAQIKDFPEMERHGAKIWIMVAATEREYAKLFLKPNWYYYLYCLNCGLSPEI